MAVPSITKESLLVPVTEDGSVPDDSYEVEIAVLTVGEKEEPENDDWKMASWDSLGRAKILIGDGTSLNLENGYYDIWVRVTTPSERPVRRAGRIRIT